MCPYPTSFQYLIGIDIIGVIVECLLAISDFHVLNGVVIFTVIVSLGNDLFDVLHKEKATKSDHLLFRDQSPGV